MYEGRDILARELGVPKSELVEFLKGSKDIVDCLEERAKGSDRKTIFSSGIQVTLVDAVSQEGIGPLIKSRAENNNLFDPENLEKIQTVVRNNGKKLKDFKVRGSGLIRYHMDELKSSLGKICVGFSEKGEMNSVYGAAMREGLVSDVYSEMDRMVDAFLKNPSHHHTFLSLFDNKSDNPLLQEAATKAALGIAGRLRQSKSSTDPVLIGAALFFDNISMITDDPAYVRQGLFHEDGMRHAQESAKFVQEKLGVKDESVIAGIMHSHRYSVKNGNGEIPIVRAPGVVLTNPERYALAVNALYECLSRDYEGRSPVEAIYKLNILSSQGFIDAKVAKVLADMIDSPVNAGYETAFSTLSSFEKYVKSTKGDSQMDRLARNCCSREARYVWSRSRGQVVPEILCKSQGCPRRGEYAGVQRGVEYVVGNNQVVVPDGKYFKCTVLNGRLKEQLSNS